MIKNQLSKLGDVIEALPENIMDGDEATVADQASEVCEFAHGLYAVMCISVVPSEHRRTTVDALESIIADCQARIKELNEQTLAELELGAEVPGFKLKAGSERRSWRDESKVAEVLAKHNIESPQLYDMKLKGIPAVEKLLSKAGYKPEARETILKELVDVSVGRPSLVKEK